MEELTIGDSIASNDELRQATAELIDLEKASIREYKSLAGDSSGLLSSAFQGAFRRNDPRFRKASRAAPVFAGESLRV